MFSKTQKIIIKKGEKAKKRHLKDEAKKQNESKKDSLWRNKEELLKKATKVQKIKLKIKWAFWKKSEEKLLKEAYDEYLEFKKKFESN